MAVHQGLKGALQGDAVELPVQLQPFDVVVERLALVQAREDPQAALGVAERIIRGLRRGLQAALGDAAVGLDAARLGAHAALFKEVANAQDHAELAVDAADQSDRAQRVSADGKPGAFHAYLGHPKGLGPQRAQTGF